MPVYAGEISCRSLGCAVEAFDETGRSVVDELGELVITRPMPSMPVGFWGDADGSRYREAYFDDFPGVWRHGDWITITERGTCVVTGRSDATLNRGGVRLGTAEFYSVVESLPGVADSLVVHLEDDEGGAGTLMLFVVLAEGQELDDDLRSSIAKELRTRLSPRHVPDAGPRRAGLPRTLSGKKLEVPVKKILRGAAVDDVAAKGALTDPDSLDVFVELRPLSGQRASRSSAIWMVLRAAPLRRLSPLTNITRPVLVVERVVLADAADEARVGAGRLQRSGHVDEAHAGSGRQDLGRPLGRDGPAELGVDRQRVAGEHRHADAGARDPEVGDAEDLAALVAELLLLVGLVPPVVDDGAGQRQDVERDGRDVLDRRREVDRRPVVGERVGLVDDGEGLRMQLLDAGDARARHRLVGGGDEPDQPGLVVQRLEHRHRGHGGAVGVGDDASRSALAMSPGLTSLTTSGMSGSLRNAEELSMTVTPASANRGTCTRDIVAPAENSAMSSPDGSAVSASSMTISPPFQGSVLPAERDGREEAHLVGREVALGEELPHDGAHLPGGTDDSDAGHRPVPP